MATATRSVRAPHVKLLWGLAAGRCAFRNECRQECVADKTSNDPNVVIGEMAHIVAHSDDGPRGDRTFPASQRSTYENLILLCPTHHALVDGQANSYSIADLRRWKADHESWVRTRLATEMPNVGFAELEIVVKGVFGAAAPPSEQFRVTPPAEKLARNRLTQRVRPLLQMGLAAAPEVARFVDHIAVMQPDFPERVKAGFVERYANLRSAGVDGDELFSALHEFARGNSSDLVRYAAALAVLGYFFMKCEVFEP